MRAATTAASPVATFADALDATLALVLDRDWVVFVVLVGFEVKTVTADAALGPATIRHFPTESVRSRAAEAASRKHWLGLWGMKSGVAALWVCVVRWDRLGAWNVTFRSDGAAPVLQTDLLCLAHPFVLVCGPNQGGALSINGSPAIHGIVIATLQHVYLFSIMTFDTIPLFASLRLLGLGLTVVLCGFC